jgi:hypothetical protein
MGTTRGLKYKILSYFCHGEVEKEPNSYAAERE